MDAELIVRAREGDAGAFDALIGPYIEPAWRFAATMLRDPEEARDAVQEAALKAFRKLGQLRDETDPRPWFFAIVANQCRTTRRQPFWGLIRMAEPAGQSIEGPEEDTVRGIDLQQAIAGLGRDDRMVLHLFYYLDLPQAEVGRIMGISIPAVKARLHRAVRRLRPALSVGEVPL